MITSNSAKKLLHRRKLNKASTKSLLDTDFEAQTNFITDPARLKAAFCTRRAAKSYTGGLYLVKACLETPGVSCLFIGLTRLSAKGIVWKDILKVINRKHKLGMVFNETLLTATFPNGSVINLMGVDSDENEKEKLLGQKYKLVICDESASYSINLRELVYGILKPAVVDYQGTICLLGTSGNLTKGLFFDITNGREPGWSVHKWTAYQNPYVAKNWHAEIEDIKTNRPLFMETPLFKQWYLNQWVVDDEKLVYKFNRDRNLYDALPLYPTGEWAYYMGVDLGYEDASGFVVVATHEYDKTLYIVESYKKSKMDITDVANKIKFFKNKYKAYKVVIDGANKQAVEEIQKRHHIPLITADKQGKEDFIEIMNSEFIQARIKLNAAENQGLADEYGGLIWKTDGDKIIVPHKEHPACENHLCDAALYIWRHCHQYHGEAPVQGPKWGTKEWADQQQSEMWEKAQEHFEEQAEMLKRFEE